MALQPRQARRCRRRGSRLTRVGRSICRHLDLRPRSGRGPRIESPGLRAQDPPVGADSLSGRGGRHLPGETFGCARADRVLLRLDTFEATISAAFSIAPSPCPGKQWIPADAAFPVNGRSIKSQLSSVPACQKIVKKAVVEKLKAAYGVEWFARPGQSIPSRSRCWTIRRRLTIDTSGPGLHKRGYRPLVGKAPLKETLAAALVLLSLLESRAAAGRSVLRLRHDSRSRRR